ncbi:phosphatase PAP2 family protein [Natronolimnohabitans innermongolicus]|uniref:Phosphoesterase PA-phosphatase-related protein n=1 Tax=Natronolimnohabitans innermongolicus JCM 12255 TaxID=1227499 RepID=L9X618_9EURY|nr:phosphatase PAP2 family protein [Natronolimnohabitans innermongolicus]ELY57042.1 phosphoesterase PA-phosphatase-related protein [Natronolimnohabitans innermongolicus JCM 12255]
MYRGGDLLEAIHGSLPEWLLLLAALVTRLGDVWVVISITIVGSWLVTWHRQRDERTRALTSPTPSEARESRAEPAVWIVAALVGGLAAMTALKYAFALPRPEQVVATPGLLSGALESAYVSSVTLGGYGFPSGHAVGATVAYGLLALVVPFGSRRQRFAVAGAVALSVSLSRVLLTVHYPGDVVAGVALGVAYLAGVWWLLERSPLDRTTTAFGLALGLAVVAIAVSGAGGRSVTYAALAAGGLVVWTLGQRQLSPSPSSSGRSSYHAESATVALGLVAALVALESDPAAVAPAAVLGGLVVAPAVWAGRETRST